MSAAHGGQVLLSQTVVDARGRPPAGRRRAARPGRACACATLRSPNTSSRLLHPQLRQQFPALRSLEATPNNLPQQLTSFIGREHELAEVKRLLGTTRLLTLLGIGGLGKSRLSLQVAADVLDDYPDGVWFVELAPVADARLVPQVVASVLGVKEEAGHVGARSAREVRHGSPPAARARQLRAPRAGLRGARAQHCWSRGRRSRSSPSSRERLNIGGEKTYPARAARRSAAAAEARARRAHGSSRRCACSSSARSPRSRRSRSRADNAAAVAEICHRLDGIPLALELAAARVRAMSVDKIAERLSDRFRLLSGGDRTALAAAADVARADRLELRPPHGRRSCVVPPPRGIRGRLHARSRGKGWRRRRQRRARRARSR